MTIAEQTIGFKLAWIGAAILVLLFFGAMVIRDCLIYHRRRLPQRTRMMIGICLVALGAIVHQSYFFIWRIVGDPRMIDRSLYVEAPAITLIIMGYSLHLSPIYEGWVGRRFWWTLPTAFALALYFLGGAFGA